MQPKYLLDANIFIQSHNINYHPSFCELFWDWIVSGYEANIFCSIDKIKNELIHQANSDDELSVRLRAKRVPDDFFKLSLGDPLVTQSYEKLMEWVNRTPRYEPEAIHEFSRHTIADPFLVATAMAYNYVIVTAEKASNTPKKVKIPDAALANGVRCITLPELLRKHAQNNFQLIL